MSVFNNPRTGIDSGLKQKGQMIHPLDMVENRLAFSICNDISVLGINV